MSEQNSYARFREKCARAGDRFDRIENVLVDGMFDVNVCIEGVESWLELKSPREPKRPTTALFASNHKVSQDQKNWALRQRNAKGRCFFLLHTDKRWILLPSHIADGINEMSMRSIMEHALWYANTPVNKQYWEQLRMILCQR